VTWVGCNASVSKTGKVEKGKISNEIKS